MHKKNRLNECSIFKVIYSVALISLFILTFGCSKQEPTKQSIDASDSSTLQINYLSKIKNSLRDSLNENDFSAIDFSGVFKSKDVRSKNYFVRLKFKDKKISTDFILLKTDSTGTLIKGKIVKVKFDNQSSDLSKVTVAVASLKRTSITYLKNNDNDHTTTYKNEQSRVSSSNQSSLLAEEQPVGEQTLPDVVVTGYIYNDPTPYYWYCFDDMLGENTTGGGTYTYGLYETSGGGGGAVSGDETSNITYEDASQPSIDVSKYIKCFSLLSNTGATFKITIYSDIPVNDDPNKLFDYSTGACGHSFLQFSKYNGSNLIQQDVGFYPESGWKSIANSSVTSKLVDNSGHEFNASLTVTVNATQFQNALNKMQSEANTKYDIDDFNCTDFALSVFNAAASQKLNIPRRHIPNGTFGTESNTPQGLYVELQNLQKNGGYPGGQISIPNNAPHAGKGHGACN